MKTRRNPLLVLGAAVLALAAGIGACTLAIVLLVQTIG
jgi:hypothetical protein